MYSIQVPDETAMLNLGRSWAGKIPDGSVIFFAGELGAGKTTLITGLLWGFGFDGMVTSPTYTLVEPYTVNQRSIYHFDLYRLKSAGELEMIGVRDMIGPDTISLIEWPDRGAGLLPTADCKIQIEYLRSGRKVNIVPGRMSKY